MLALVIFTAAIGTISIDLHTARGLALFQTNVLWRDQWWFLGELQSVEQGKNWAEILWSVYWGHRPVIPRLLFYLDARYFSFRNAPLLYLSWTLVAAQAALIAGVSRAIFGSVQSWRFIAALVVLLNLYFSSFQLENLIWALQVQYVVVSFCAVLAFIAFAKHVDGGRHRQMFLAASCAAAFVGSLTMANGLAIWAVLALQAYLCKARRRVWVAYIGVFLMFGAVYSIGYSTRGEGMGMLEQFRRPLSALEITAMVLGGPLVTQSFSWSVAAGAIALGATIVLIVVVHREAKPAWPSVHLAMVVLMCVTAALTVGGRISPEFVWQRMATHGDILPSRYFTFSFLAWASLFALCLWLIGKAGPIAIKAVAVTAALVPCYFVFAYARLQPLVADSWVDAMRAFDATGTSFLVNAPDWERQQLLWGGRSEMEGWVAFQRAHRLANFSESRFEWLNRPWAVEFSKMDANACEGQVESWDRVGDTSWRVNGWAWERKADQPPLDVVVVDSEGLIRGLGRSGVRHHDTGGHTAKVVMYRAGWIGYVAGVPAVELSALKAFAVLNDGRTICPIPARKP